MKVVRGEQDEEDSGIGIVRDAPLPTKQGEPKRKKKKKKPEKTEPRRAQIFDFSSETGPHFWCSQTTLSFVV